ncbi:MAG TPA: hypothetical protein PLY93_02435 [Turneriella sp.]|nr:hypothetical protein [Turneriella sp.]
MRSWFISIALAVLTLHCVGSDALYDPPGGRGFWARRMDMSSGSSTFYRLTAMYAGGSKHADVYTEVGQDVSGDIVDNLLAAFENAVVPIEHFWLRPPTDIDKNDKVILLLLNIQDGYSTQGSFVGGYFDPYNNYSDESVNAVNSSYHSNEAEMLYLDTNPWLQEAKRTQDFKAYYATIAHEYQHLLQFGTYFRGEKENFEPPWVDEGMAEVMADLTGYGPQLGRANNFRRSLLQNTSLIKENATFSLENYAHSYIYFRYLADVYGLGIIGSIFKGTHNGVPGVNTALEATDTKLLANCGNTATLPYPHFSCSYRFMWGAMVNNTLGDSPAGVRVVFNGAASANLAVSGTYTYALTPANIEYKNELANSLATASIVDGNGDTGALESYAIKLYKNNKTGAEPNFSLCAACRLTLVAGNKYFAVFNHDVSTATTASGRVSDTVHEAPQQPAAGALPVVPEETQSNNIGAHKINLHFSIPQNLQEFLTP